MFTHKDDNPCGHDPSRPDGFGCVVLLIVLSLAAGVLHVVEFIYKYM